MKIFVHFEIIVFQNRFQFYSVTKCNLKTRDYLLALAAYDGKVTVLSYPPPAVSDMMAVMLQRSYSQQFYCKKSLFYPNYTGVETTNSSVVRQKERCWILLCFNVKIASLSDKGEPLK